MSRAERSSRAGIVWAVFGISLLVSLPAAAAEAAAVGDASRLADAFAEISNAVFDNHLNSPARQQMLLDGARAILADQGKPAGPGFARRVSAIGDQQQILELFQELTADVAADKLPAAQRAMVQGLVAGLPDQARLMPAGEYRVMQQFQENQYVGIGIVLSQQDGAPMIAKAFLGGPARNGGANSGDLIQEVDGVSTDGKDLGEVVQMLRGQRGEPVSIIVKHPDDEQPRTIDMVRDVIPFQNVVGLREVEEEVWEFKADDNAPIAYLNIKAIRGSTVRELQLAARKLQAEQFKALVLDLRQTEPGSPRHTAMLADVLMGEGVIGKELSAQGEQVYESRAVSEFSGWPMAVLIGPGSHRTVEWLAAALQDSGRAELIGELTAGNPYVLKAVELASGDALVVLHSELRRADGASFVATGQILAGPMPGGAIAANAAPPIDKPQAGANQAAAPHGQPPMTRTGGVQPDHLVQAAQLLTGRGGYRAIQGAEQAQKPAAEDRLGDPQLAKAVEILRALLDSENPPNAS